MLIDAIYSLFDLVLDSPPTTLAVISMGAAIAFFFVGR